MIDQQYDRDALLQKLLARLRVLKVPDYDLFLVMLTDPETRSWGKELAGPFLTRLGADMFLRDLADAAVRGDLDSFSCSQDAVEAYDAAARALY